MLIKLFGDSPVPATANQTSKTYDVSGATEATVQFIQAGGSSIVGTFEVDGSADVPPVGQTPGANWDPTNWTNISGTQAVAAPGTYPLCGVMGFFPFIRVRWLYTSGTGGTVDGSLFVQDADNLSGTPGA